VTSHAAEIRDARPSVLLDELADLSVRLDEAQEHLLLGFAADDVNLSIAAARRIESIGFLMGEKTRAYLREKR